MAFFVGLTGGIGSGKSTVAELFAGRGATVIDTDWIAHALTAPGGRAMPAIVAAFGSAVATPSGALDRAAMRRLAFSDPSARKRLEAILHPLIGEETRALAASAAGPYSILVVPLLVETGHYRRRVDRILVVDCPEEAQVARVMARSGLTAEEVRAIMASQASRAERLAAADDVIVNDGSLADLEARVAAFHTAYLQAAALADRAAEADRSL